jgi:hypothetical protein
VPSSFVPADAGVSSGVGQTGDGLSLRLPFLPLLVEAALRLGGCSCETRGFLHSSTEQREQHQGHNREPEDPAQPECFRGERPDTRDQARADGIRSTDEGDGLRAVAACGLLGDQHAGHEDQRDQNECDRATHQHSLPPNAGREPTNPRHERQTHECADRSGMGLLAVHPLGRLLGSRAAVVHFMWTGQRDGRPYCGARWRKQDEGTGAVFRSTYDGGRHRLTASDDVLRPMGRATSGVKGMSFREGDELLSMNVVRAGTFVFTATDGGYAKRTPVDEYRVQGRGGLGIKAAKIVEDRGSLVGALVVESTDEILAITLGGAVGDIWFVGLILRREPGTMIEDLKDGLRFHRPRTA